VQSVPPFHAPAFDDAMSFHDEVRQAALGQLLAHRQPRLTPANDQSLDLLNRQGRVPFSVFEQS
jgi:hypothetical protein